MTAASAQQASMRFAAIDIGTVTSRLLVADTDGVRVHVLAREYEVTNLGEGVDATGVISPAALARVGAAIDRFVDVRDAHATRQHPILKTVVMATSAARDAKNADDFAAMLAERGLELEVISGQREAELTFAGVTAEAARGSNVAIVDVGGGSTEVSFGVAGDGIVAAHSFDIGCRRMTERFFRADPPTSAEVEAAYAWAAEQFEAWRDSMPQIVEPDRSVAQVFRSLSGSASDGMVPSEELRPAADCTLYAVAGTATSAISMHEGMRVYDSARVHGARLGLPALKAILAKLASMDEQEREAVVGLDPRRAPVIVAGLLILVCVMDTFGFDAFTASESDILQGMILWAAKSHDRS